MNPLQASVQATKQDESSGCDALQTVTSAAEDTVDDDLDECEARWLANLAAKGEIAG